MKKPNVHTSWDPLKEVWLGDVWPAHFYDDLPSEIRDSWYQITEWTKEDLKKIELKFKEFGVNVLRPYVDGPKNLYVSRILDDSNGKLLKPPITPRDANAVIGDKLFVGDAALRACYQPLLDQYNNNNLYYYAQFKTNPKFNGANIVKLGRDIIIDLQINENRRWPDYNKLPPARKHQLVVEAVFKDYDDFLTTDYPLLGDQYRIYLATQGGHCDGCFMPLNKKLMIATKYFQDYEVLLNDWEKIFLSNPTYHNFNHKSMMGNQQKSYWHVPGMKRAHPHFNEYIEKNCSSWIGDFTETFFEVNVVMIDEKNMICMGETNSSNDFLFEDLTKRGINCHVVPWRTRSFWDGGIHCITLDTIREGQLIDYYPEHGDYGLKQVASKYFNYSNEKFHNEYNKWKKTQSIEFVETIESKPWLDKLKNIQTLRQ